MEFSPMADMSAQGASEMMSGGGGDDQDKKSSEQAGNMLMKVAQDPEMLQTAAMALA